MSFSSKECVLKPSQLTRQSQDEPLSTAKARSIAIGKNEISSDVSLRLYAKQGFGGTRLRKLGRRMPCGEWNENGTPCVAVKKGVYAGKMEREQRFFIEFETIQSFFVCPATSVKDRV
ncbi:hypothetical protein COLO4_05131 [Corchorus olitorius]|uniref:Uncharacterized protein n=1 Tax=Corchorus olitorius TaxID=93759 RepID=A0A1R3KRV1_9ROSI|nr:hypothetical protein COLO4_05131 [Corchorus olitorius]